MFNDKYGQQYDTKRTVNVEFDVLTHQEESDEMISCYIPSVGVYFSARNEEAVNKKAAVMIKFFIKFWDEYNNNGEKKDFSSMKRDGIPV